MRAQMEQTFANCEPGFLAFRGGNADQHNGRGDHAGWAVLHSGDCAGQVAGRAPLVMPTSALSPAESVFELRD